MLNRLRTAVALATLVLLGGCGSTGTQGGQSSVTTAVPQGRVATCPVGSRPDQPGPAAGPRPALNEPGVSAAMDAQSGRVVVVDDRGATWTLDVCTGRWSEPATQGSPPSGRSRLLYEPASDRTYAFGQAGVAAYDAQTAAWSTVAGSGHAVLRDGVFASSRLVLDDLSRIAYLYRTDTGELHAYDLTRNAWTTVPQGRVRPPHGVDAAAAFDASTRTVLLAVFAGLNGQSGGTWRFDPTWHTWTAVDGAPPVLNVGYGSLGTEMAYDSESRTTVLFSDARVATFDSRTAAWTTPPRGTGWPAQVPMEAGAGVVVQPERTSERLDFTVGPLSRLGHALVDDVFNGRVIVLGGQARGPGGTWREGRDAWAYRVRDNAWTEVVPP